MYMHICMYMSKSRKCNNKEVDEVGAVMAIKCPRPDLGPLNGVQAITIGEYIDCSYKMHFPLPNTIQFLMCTHLDSTLFAYGGLCLSFLEVDGQVFRRRPSIALES